MSNPFSDLVDRDNTAYDDIDTPSTTGTLAELAETPSAPEPTILLHQIQEAVEDVSQLVGRFGHKMAQNLTTLPIKEALFAEPRSLRLPCLQDADNLPCQVTKLHHKTVGNATSAPLLWWLWDELLNHYSPTSHARGCKFEFTPACACKTGMVLPYTIAINLLSVNNHDGLELTASYGGLYRERRIFHARITSFCFPETKRYGKSTAIALDVDRNTYQKEGCLADTLDYLMPRSGSIWRHAMEAFPSDEEENLFVALAGTCKAQDDRCRMSGNQDRQCQNLLQRFPVEAREYVTNAGLVGKKGGSHSRMANQPPGPKD
ncbi:hypothetical protein CABS02_14591 [Colletotrichum abscissum]|uniref:Uncharacterized protein n=1 Tax=Colletotrichum abscissum TaxID=1671311 RepID=A0A9Q0AWR9_9PEZI|nr:hypothetical protein CABS02_14591 [Colletotrichum abscissum]